MQWRMSGVMMMMMLVVMVMMMMMGVQATPTQNKNGSEVLNDITIQDRQLKQNCTYVKRTNAVATYQLRLCPYRENSRSDDECGSNESGSNESDSNESNSNESGQGGGGESDSVGDQEEESDHCCNLNVTSSDPEEAEWHKLRLMTMVKEVKEMKVTVTVLQVGQEMLDFCAWSEEEGRGYTITVQNSIDMFWRIGSPPEKYKENPAAALVWDGFWKHLAITFIACFLLLLFCCLAKYNGRWRQKKRLVMMDDVEDVGTSLHTMENSTESKVILHPVNEPHEVKSHHFSGSSTADMRTLGTSSLTLPSKNPSASPSPLPPPIPSMPTASLRIPPMPTLPVPIPPSKHHNPNLPLSNSPPETGLPPMPSYRPPVPSLLLSGQDKIYDDDEHNYDYVDIGALKMQMEKDKVKSQRIFESKRSMDKVEGQSRLEVKSPMVNDYDSDNSLYESIDNHKAPNMKLKGCDEWTINDNDEEEEYSKKNNEKDQNETKTDDDSEEHEYDYIDINIFKQQMDKDKMKGQRILEAKSPMENCYESDNSLYESVDNHKTPDEKLMGCINDEEEENESESEESDSEEYDSDDEEEESHDDDEEEESHDDDETEAIDHKTSDANPEK